PDDTIHSLLTDLYLHDPKYDDYSELPKCRTSIRRSNKSPWCFHGFQNNVEFILCKNLGLVEFQ
ncbi:9277_t:CDS:1, partial [Dentiscutata heterogama]